MAGGLWHLQSEEAEPGDRWACVPPLPKKIPTNSCWDPDIHRCRPSAMDRQRRWRMLSLAHPIPLWDGYAGAHIHTDVASLLFIVQITGGGGRRAPGGTRDRSVAHP